MRSANDIFWKREREYLCVATPKEEGQRENTRDGGRVERGGRKRTEDRELIADERSDTSMDHI